LFDLNIYTVSI